MQGHFSRFSKLLILIFFDFSDQNFDLKRFHLFCGSGAPYPAKRGTNRGGFRCGLSEGRAEGRSRAVCRRRKPLGGFGCQRKRLKEICYVTFLQTGARPERDRVPPASLSRSGLWHTLRGRTRSARLGGAYPGREPGRHRGRPLRRHIAIDSVGTAALGRPSPLECPPICSVGAGLCPRPAWYGNPSR